MTERRESRKVRLREERTGADSRHLWGPVDGGSSVTSPALGQRRPVELSAR